MNRADARKAISVALPNSLYDMARGAWLWAYRGHHTDAASLADWINEAIAAADPAADLTEIDGAITDARRVFWLDHAVIDKLNSYGGVPQSRAFRAILAATVDDTCQAAAACGHQIEPHTTRLPNKVWRQTAR